MNRPHELPYAEKHRPQLHFSPARNWMNDPNGMVYYDGTYHLFYQYNPADKVWNDMHWGHATSSDLIHWYEQPIALHSEPEGLGYIFSGCALVDWRNSSGLGQDGRPPLIAIFTHSSDSGVQVQSIAYSNDAGETWAMYDNNPVIPNHEITHFRDPKVFWNEESAHWIMVLAADKVVKFYRSKNLIDWSFFYDFGEKFSVNDGVWECPDLFVLDVTGTSEKKWVLLVSLNPGGPNGGSATRYFVGHFDGEGFYADHTDVRWLDYGPDNYAGVTWSDVLQNSNRRILLGWMSNWQYANQVPTDPWRGAMTLPRELSLIPTDLGLLLAAKPIPEIELLYQGAPIIHERLLLNEPISFPQQGELPELFELVVALESPALAGRKLRLRLFNDADEQLIFDIDLAANEVRMDRERASFGLDEDCGFFTKLNAPIIASEAGQYSIKLIKDVSSLELFTGEGLGIFSALYFVENQLNKLEIMPFDCEEVALENITIQPLSSIWRHCES
tara:strand:+ start:945 stop:2447 length:1503 start_codon:yes stop_codon:yes gene_type:complete